MKIISNKKKYKIGRIIAATRYIISHTFGETDMTKQLEYLTKIYENLADLAFEIGGFNFANTEIPEMEKILILHLEELRNAK